jgi:TonB family protein
LVFVNAWDATGQNQDKSAQEFVSNAVREKINSQTERRDLTRDAFAVDYDGRHFFRSDYKSLLQTGMSEYWSYIFTKFRGYFIGETIDSSSQEGLDDAANSLQGISFQEDQVNSTCVMSPVDVGSASKPRSGFPMRVRVSSGVSAGLLSKKVQPQYPEEAKKEGVQGRVVLQAEIDENGNVQHLMLISGHPTLAPAAIAAVNQWKYKPYLLNDQPVAVETQVIVDFELKRR